MRLSNLLLLAAFGLSCDPASAGADQHLPVVIDHGHAYGSLSSARVSNGEQHIGCFVDTASGVKCDAADGNRHFHCGLPKSSPLFPAFARNVHAISSASFLEVFWDPATFECTDLRVVNGSDHLPDHPAPVNVVGPGVVIDFVERRAVGALGAARYGSGLQELLACEIWAASGAIRCYARDAAGTTVTCATTEAVNPAFAENVRAIDAFSSLLFEFDFRGGSCARIMVGKGSSFLP